MIKIEDLKESDIGRNVTYHREYCKREFGTLSSQTNTTIFVKFKGPNGEGCEPADVSFDHISEKKNQ